MTADILVVTPQPEIGNLLHINLEEVGDFQITVAESCSEALIKAREIPFQLTILDSTLSDQPFAQFSKSLSSQYPNLPQLIIPPQNDPQHSSLTGLHPSGFLNVPFYMPDVAEMINNILTSKPKPAEKNSASFSQDELDSLLASFEAAENEVSSEPSGSLGQDELDNLLAGFTAAENAPAEAPKPASSGALQQNDLDNLLASLAAAETAPAEAPKPASSGALQQNDLDNLLASLAAAETAPAEAPKPASSGALQQNDLDNLLASLTAAETSPAEAPIPAPVSVVPEAQPAQVDSTIPASSIPGEYDLLPILLKNTWAHTGFVLQKGLLIIHKGQLGKEAVLEISDHLKKHWDQIKKMISCVLSVFPIIWVSICYMPVRSVMTRF